MSEHGEGWSHKAHSGVNVLILYELFSKLHEYVPEWVEWAREVLRHAHV